MRVIFNEYKVDNKKILIEHDLIKNEFAFIIMNGITREYTSELISDLVACRAKAFQHMGVLTQ